MAIIKLIKQNQILVLNIIKIIILEYKMTLNEEKHLGPI